MSSPHGCRLPREAGRAPRFRAPAWATAQRCPAYRAALLQLAQTDPLVVLAHPLLDVAFEQGLFGCHLKPHDAPARTAPKRSCSLGCEMAISAPSWPDRGETNQGGITTILGARYDPQERTQSATARRALLSSRTPSEAARSASAFFTYRYCHLVDGAVEGEGDRRRQVPVAAFILKNEARSRVGAQQLARHLWLGEFVEELAGAVQRNNVVDVQPFESGDGLADIVL